MNRKIKTLGCGCSSFASRAALASLLLLASSTKVFATGADGRSHSFFPLDTDSTWVYGVKSASQQLDYHVTDRVRGSQFVEAVNEECQVVDEDYQIDRGGIRPVLYCAKEGFLSRVSGLKYTGERIEFPAYGMSIEQNLLPIELAPNGSWSDLTHPYGNLARASTYTQRHKSFAESREIEVPAGRFSGCIRVETETSFEGGPYKQPLTLDYTDWYAPGVGLIKTTASEGGVNGKMIERVELLTFQRPPNAPHQQ